MRRGAVRLAAALGASVAAAVGVVAACGREDPPRGPGEGPLRVEVVVDRADGEVPPGFVLRAADGRAIPLAPEPGEGPGFLVARGPEEEYGLEAPAGWGVVSDSNRMPLSPGMPPAAIAVGRERTVYLVPPGPASPPLETEAAAVPGGSPAGTAPPAPPAPLDTEVVAGSSGRVLVRFRDPAQWRGRVTVFVRTKGGGVASGGAELRDGGKPTGVVALPTPARPLDVRVLLAAGGRPAAGARVRAEGTVGPLVARSEGRADRRGVAALPWVPTSAPTLRIVVSTDGGESVFDGPTLLWTSAAEIPLLHAEVPDSARSRLTVGGVWPPTHDGDLFVEDVQVRPEGGDSYARPPGDPETGFLVPPGRYHLLATDGTRVAVEDAVPVKGPEFGLVTRQTLGPAGDAPEACRVTFRVKEPARAGWRLRLSVRRREGDALVSAHGFVVDVEGGRDHAMRLPVGEYEATLESTGPTERRGHPALPFSLPTPGMRAYVDVPAR